jgi:hypothetical protein
MSTPEQQLLALASQLQRPLSQDPRTTTPEEREVSALVDALQARQRTFAMATAWLESRLAKEADERHERETDPLTKLRAPLLPSSPHDVVVIGCGPAQPFFEFRRDGQRFQYTTPGPVCCIPAADWALENWGPDWVDTKRTFIEARSMLVATAGLFDNLAGLASHAYTSQRWPAGYRAVPLEGLASSLVASADVTQLIHWFKQASEVDVRDDIIRRMTALDRLAAIGLEPTIGPSWSLAPPFRKDVPAYTGG